MFVLIDINLEGGREGIEVARWLRKVCEAPIVFVTGYTDHDTVERIHEQVPEHRCCPNRSIVTAFPTPWRRFPRSSTTLERVAPLALFKDGRGGAMPSKRNNLRPPRRHPTYL
jgi:CheY-like chemotaxis protein